MPGAMNPLENPHQPTHPGRGDNGNPRPSSYSQGNKHSLVPRASPPSFICTLGSATRPGTRPK
jgi:hypothetical protein